MSHFSPVKVRERFRVFIQTQEPRVSLNVTMWSHRGYLSQAWAVEFVLSQKMERLCRCYEGEPSSCKLRVRFFPRKSVLALSCFMMRHIGQEPVVIICSVRKKKYPAFFHDHWLNGDSVTRPEPKPIPCWTIILNIIKSRPTRTGNYPWIYTFHWGKYCNKQSGLCPKYAP